MTPTTKPVEMLEDIATINFPRTLNYKEFVSELEKHAKTFDFNVHTHFIGNQSIASNALTASLYGDVYGRIPNGPHVNCHFHALPAADGNVKGMRLEYGDNNAASCDERSIVMKALSKKWNEYFAKSDGART